MAATSGPSALGPPRPRVPLAVGVASAAVALEQAYDYAARFLTPAESYAGLLGVPALLLVLLYVAVRAEGRPFRDYGFLVTGRWSVPIAFSSLLVLLSVVLRLDPGFLFGFGRTHPLPIDLFGFFLLSAPVIALAEGTVFIGYLGRTLSRVGSLRLAVLVSAAFLAAFTTDGPLLLGLGPSAAIEYVFTTSLVSWVLGIVLMLYYYKAQWSLLGPYTLLSALTAIGALLPVGALYPSWEVGFAAELIADAALLIVVGVGLQEPRLQALRYLRTRIGPRRYRFRNRARDRVAVRDTLVGAAVVGVVVLSATYAVPALVGTPTTPFLAIATGSMVPTFHRGEFVVIHHVAPTAIHVGTIIAFSVFCLPSPTVHRVIRIVSAGPNWVYQTKGDANPVQDPCTVPYSHVLGAVVFYVPYLGFLILDPLFAASVVALLIIVPLAWRGGRT